LNVDTIEPMMKENGIKEESNFFYEGMEVIK